MREAHSIKQLVLWDSEPEKRCGRCKKIKPLSKFGRIKGKVRSYCIDCRRTGRPRVLHRDMTEKRCPRCKAVFPIAEFRKKGQGENPDAAVWHYCRKCNSDDCRERLRAKIKSGKAREEYKQRYKTKRWQKLLAQYGLTKEQYETLEREQNGLCLICGEPESAIYKGVQCRLVVDHDHETNEVRGLLCRLCNLGIGYFKENIKRLTGAIAYLRSKGK